MITLYIFLGFYVGVGCCVFLFTVSIVILGGHGRPFIWSTLWLVYVIIECNRVMFGNNSGE